MFLILSRIRRVFGLPDFFSSTHAMRTKAARNVTDTTIIVSIVAAHMSAPSLVEDIVFIPFEAGLPLDCCSTKSEDVLPVADAVDWELTENADKWQTEDIFAVWETPDAVAKPGAELPLGPAELPPIEEPPAEVLPVEEPPTDDAAEEDDEVKTDVAVVVKVKTLFVVE